MMLRNKKLLPILLAGAILVAAGFGLYIFLQVHNEHIPGAGDSAHGGVFLNYQGERCRLRPYIHTVLLMGIDHFAREDTAEEAGWMFSFDAPSNNTQADFLALLVFDLKARTVTPIQLNRDTMCNVPYLSLNGKVLGTRYEQLALSHNAGSGKEDSCRYVAGVVEELLMGAPVDHYLSLSMDAVPLVNDMVGGVTLTMEEDYISEDANGLSLRKGDVVFLRGEDALSFLRMRRHDRVDVNAARMGRHRLYLDAFARQAKAASRTNAQLISDSFDALRPYMFTDLDLNSYSDFLGWLSYFEILPVQTLDGVYHMGEQWAEFYPDPDTTWHLLKEVFT